MGGFLLFLFILFCFQIAYRIQKNKKRNQSAAANTATFEQAKSQIRNPHHNRVENSISTGSEAPPSSEDKLSKDLPPIGSIQRALYEMERAHAEAQQAEFERRSATERELTRSESARQALRAINEQKKAESRTNYDSSWINGWDEESDWSEQDYNYSDREQCEIHYTDIEGNFSIRDVEPINVRENSQGKTILVAIDTEVNELRYFHLDRIELVSYNGNDYTQTRDIGRILRKLAPECN